MNEPVVGHFVFLVTADKLLRFRATRRHEIRNIGCCLVLAVVGVGLLNIARFQSEWGWLALGLTLIGAGSVALVICLVRFRVEFKLSHNTGRLSYGDKILCHLRDVTDVTVVEESANEGYTVYVVFADESQTSPPDWYFGRKADAREFARIIRKFVERAAP